jgi:hypothetical protein
MGNIMKARLILVCAATGIAASAFGAAPAGAEGATKGSIVLSENTAAPGDHVQVQGTCSDRKVTTGKVISTVLDAPDLQGRDDSMGGLKLVSTGTVKADAKPGVWPVSFMCDNVKVTGQLTVVAKGTLIPYAAIGIQDREIKPGQEVEVVASCYNESFTSSKVASSVLTSPDLVRKAYSDPTTPLFATGHISKNARPGRYSLSFMCDGKKVSGTFTIVGTPAKAQVPVKPKGAPETGGDPDAIAWGA